MTSALIQREFQALGYPSTAINKITLPYSLVPLSMGLGPDADTYSVFARVAYPDDANVPQGVQFGQLADNPPSADEPTQFPVGAPSCMKIR